MCVPFMYNTFPIITQHCFAKFYLVNQQENNGASLDAKDINCSETQHCAIQK